MMPMDAQIELRQPALLELFSQTIINKRLGHAYLFEGSRGTGKRDVARWLAKSLFCQAQTAGRPCQTCNNCRRLEENDLPDLIEVEPDGQSIKVDQIRQLKTEFYKSTVEGNKKVYIITDAEKMTVSAANSLLTFLEEPGKETYIFLLTTAKESILPTIRSRCQIIHFQPLKRSVMEEQLLETGMKQSDTELLSVMTNDMDEAQALAGDEAFHFLREKTWDWFKLLVSNDPMAFLYVQTNLLEAIKEKSQALLCLDLLLFHYRDLLYLSFKQDDTIVHKHLLQQYQTLNNHGLDAISVTNQLENILNGKQLLESNVQTQGVLESIAIKNLQG